MTTILLATAIALIKPSGDIELPKVEVWLGQDVAKTKGIEWPMRCDNNKLRDIMAIAEPCIITVHFPSGKKFTTWSSTVVMRQEDGNMWLVKLVPISKRQSFPTILSEAETILRRLGIHAHPRVQSHLKKWKTNIQKVVKEGFSVATGGKIENGVKSRIALEYDEADKAWFLMLELGYPEIAGLPAPM